MAYRVFIEELKKACSKSAEVYEHVPEEVYIWIKKEDFRSACLFTHKRLHSPVHALFCTDERNKNNCFDIYCVFLSSEYRKWFIIASPIASDKAEFESLAKDMVSASLFEREIKEMFGVQPLGSPDQRRLNLHDEVWPQGSYPLRKDFTMPEKNVISTGKDYPFDQVAGTGIFEVPVGPVHAGIIGPGHFRFSAAGEPIVNLEARLGFTHRGIEKLFEGKAPAEALNISECVSGDSAFVHALSFCSAVEKIAGAEIPASASYSRLICLELERLYNHVNDISGMALDVSFTFPSQYASCIKESLLRLNEEVTGSRYLKGFIVVGGVKQRLIIKNLASVILKVKKDIKALEKMLFESVSFMDRLEDTGILMKKTAEDLGVVGLCARACGIGSDLRKTFPNVYAGADFKISKEEKGDCLARLKIRFSEIEESIRLIDLFVKRIDNAGSCKTEVCFDKGHSIGAVEGWRGPVFYWVKIDGGLIERCKIVDPSFHNWPALTYAVLGNIIPDFPLCNKSFDLSYSGNDL
ncbi:MAG TPA: NADH-quinone oxidoreductase subunit C [Candidatus Omnitrophota bacterium]|nr:NADH-quinone oxidoreductase subunit C [Candidatus Omnitrophota bacterium]